VAAMIHITSMDGDVRFSFSGEPHLGLDFPDTVKKPYHQAPRDVGSMLIRRDLRWPVEWTFRRPYLSFYAGNVVVSKWEFENWLVIPV
jgi:hypothetical protein